MNLLLKLAWRNIWRNKRRTLLTLAAISFATLAAIAMRGLQLGTYEVNILNASRSFPGFIQLQKPGYQENPSIRKIITPDDSLTSYLNNNKLVKAYSPRINADGLISYKNNSYGAAIFGIDPEKEKEVTTFMDRVKEGRFVKNGNDFEIVLGENLLKNLKAQIGDTVVVLSQGMDGSLGNYKFTITGTLKTGNKEFDRMGAMINISAARELLYMYSGLNAIAVNLHTIEDIPTVQNELNTLCKDKPITALNWMQIMPDFKQSIEFDNVSGIFFLLILSLIVAFGILNTVLMSVTERFKEFGVSLSIGMPQRNLVFLVIIETVMIAVCGIIVGELTGYFINNYFAANPINFGEEFAQMYEEYGFLPQLISSTNPVIFINTAVGVILVSVIAAIYPAIKAYRLEPLKGIRYT